MKQPILVIVQQMDFSIVDTTMFTCEVKGMIKEK